MVTRSIFLYLLKLSIVIILTVILINLYYHKGVIDTIKQYESGYFELVKNKFSREHELVKLTNFKDAFPEKVKEKLVANEYLFLNRYQDFEYYNSSDYVNYITFAYKIDDKNSRTDTFYKTNIKVLLQETPYPYVQFVLKDKFEENILEYEYIFQNDNSGFYNLTINKIIKYAVLTITPEMWYDLEIIF